jgi:hypothetical protein
MKYFHSNQYDKNYIGRFSRFLKKWLKRSAWACVIAWALVGSLKIGQHYFPQTVYAEKTVEVPIEKGLSPVMQRIAKCESGNTQKGKDGQLVIHVNSDGSYDQGTFQINSNWNSTATKLGYDLTNEKDNQSFAEWLYENVGTSPWSASSKCWNK